jgi:hypothetical protein
MIADNFLDHFEGFRQHCDTLDYNGMVNPADGVFYPGVTIDIPEAVKAEVLRKMVFESGTLFLRLTLDGFDVPHQAHNDVLMGRIGMILYLNRQEHVSGGTSFVRHVDEGMENGPVDKRQEDIWRRDTNIPDKWEIIEMTDMKPNRAFIFKTEQMHRAEPPNAFGATPQEGRLVMVGFFD